MAVIRSARATSAGGVVHRSFHGQVQIVLVHRRSPTLWALPKGTPDSGETLEETARRETREETGLEVEIEASIGAITYFFVRRSTRFNKTVHFFLMRPVGGDTEAHDAEFDEVRWWPIDEALALMTYATERDVVERARAAIEAFERGEAAPAQTADGAGAVG